MKKNSTGASKQSQEKGGAKRPSKIKVLSSSHAYPKMLGKLEKKMPNANKSPYYQPDNSVASFKMRLEQHLEMMRMPISLPQHQHECSRDCHIIERNHILQVIKDFLKSVDSTS